MPTGYKINEQDRLYFVTLQIVDWIDLFTRKAYRDIVISNLDYCRKNKGLIIYAYVIMSNHIHMLLQSEQNYLSGTLRDFKSYTSKVILENLQTRDESRRKWLLNMFEYAAKKHKRNSNYQVWTHDNHAELIYSNKFIEQKLNYIHMNPVKAGIVRNPEDYLYSSATNYAGIESLLEVELVGRSFKTIK